MTRRPICATAAPDRPGSRRSSPGARLLRTSSAAFVLGAAVLLVACGSDTETGSGASSTTAGPATSAPTTTAAPTTEPIAEVPGEVVIRDYELLPETITVAAGGTVTWRNTDDVDHWMLTDDGTTVDSGTIVGGDDYVATLATPGTYPYYCDIHNTMIGTIVVE